MALVNSDSVSDGGSSGETIASNAMATHAGNLLVILTRHSGNLSVPTVTDTAGNSFVGIKQADISNASADAVEIYYAYNIVGHAANIVQAQWVGSSQIFKVLQVLEFSEVDAGDPLDISGFTNSGGASQASITSGTFSTAQAKEIIVAFAGTNNLAAITYTPDTGYTLGPSVADKDAASEYQIASSIISSGTVSMSADLSVKWGLVFAAFKARSRFFLLTNVPRP